MPVAFAGTTDEIQVAIGTPQNVGFGTWAAICRKTGADGSSYNLLRSASSTPTNRFGLFVFTDNTLRMACDANLSTGPSLTTADGWVCIAGTKATGSQTPRFHKFNYNAINTAMAHSAGSIAIADATAPGTTGHIFIGSRSGGPCWVGEILCAGFWGRALADAECEQLPFALQEWLGLRPDGLWVLDQAATTQTVIDRIGNGANETSRSGTSISTQSAVTWNYGVRTLAPHPTPAAPAGGIPFFLQQDLLVGNLPALSGGLQ